MEDREHLLLFHHYKKKLFTTQDPTKSDVNSGYPRIALSLSFKFPAFDRYCQERILFWGKNIAGKGTLPFVADTTFFEAL